MRQVGYLIVWMLMAFGCVYARAAVEGFDETFDGSGNYATHTSTVGNLEGLDNPGWNLETEHGVGVLDGTGYAFTAGVAIEYLDSDKFWRKVPGLGSFREAVRVSGLDMGFYSQGGIGEGAPRSQVRLVHSFGSDNAINLLSVYFDELDSLKNNVVGLAWYGDVPRIKDFELGIEVDYGNANYWTWLDSPETGRLITGPHRFRTTSQFGYTETELYLGVAMDGKLSGRIDHWSLEPLPDIRADINDDGALNTADIDLLSLIIRRNGSDAVADLSIDGKVDQTDLGLWIHDHRKTYFGDANLDGQFNSQDLTLVFQLGEYEDLIEDNSGWADGDWNADGEFSSSDLVVAFQDGGYEKVAAVPEPAGLICVFIGLLTTGSLRKHLRRNRTRILAVHLITCVGAMLFVARSLIANDSFDERFNGDGPYASNSGRITGLDNPGWSLRGGGEILDEGLSFALSPHADTTESQRIARNLEDRCGFKERIELRRYYQGPVELDNPPLSVSEVTFYHYNANVNAVLAITLNGGDNLDPSDWRLAGRSGDVLFAQSVPVGENIALEIHYDERKSQATFVYDSDIEDDIGGHTFGPYTATDGGVSTIFYAVAGGFADISGILDNWRYVSLCESYADFNQSGALTVQDIDLLSEIVRAGTNDTAFDLNGDTLVNQDDRVLWVQDFRNTFFGDSNLDSQFNSTDLLFVFQSGEYDDQLVGTSTWATGDWSGDGEFDSRDLVLAFQDGGYEAGPRPAVNTVPEPAGLALIIPGLLVAARSTARSRGQ